MFPTVGQTKKKVMAAAETSRKTGCVCVADRCLKGLLRTTGTDLSVGVLRPNWLRLDYSVVTMQRSGRAFSPLDPKRPDSFVAGASTVSPAVRNNRSTCQLHRPSGADPERLLDFLPPICYWCYPVHYTTTDGKNGTTGPTTYSPSSSGPLASRSTCRRLNTTA